MKTSGMIDDQTSIGKDRESGETSNDQTRVESRDFGRGELILHTEKRFNGLMSSSSLQIRRYLASRWIGYTGKKLTSRNQYWWWTTNQSTFTTPR